MINRMMRILKKAGREVHVWNRNGMRMLILRDGGRIIGLYAPDSNENFFWNNPRIYDDAQALFKETWPNSGGDRCWLTPVCRFQFGRNNNDVRCHLPWRIDPGYYDAMRVKGAMRLCNVGKVFLRQAGKKDSFGIERYPSWAENPLRHINEDWTKELSYAGYTQKTVFESFACIENMLSAWNILQLPIGGIVYIPVYGGRSAICGSLGIKSTKFLEIEDGGIRIKTDKEREHLISIPAHMSTGRIGYIRQEEKNWTLVIRNFNVNPSGEYLTCFSGSLKKPGFAVQFRSVSGDDTTSHVELHYHVPTNNSQVIYDTSQTWCFRGSRSNIHRAAKCLLGYHPQFTTGKKK